MANPGDIDILEFTIGEPPYQIDCLDTSQVYLVGFNILEDILNVYGPGLEVLLVDYQDILTQMQFTGNETANVSFQLSNTDYSANALSFKFQMFSQEEIEDLSSEDLGQPFHKRFKLQLVQPEFFNAQQNHVQKNYMTLTSLVVQDVLANYFKTSKPINIEEHTLSVLKHHFDDEHPLHALSMVQDRHVGSHSKSSAFITYITSGDYNANTRGEYHFTTYENLFAANVVANLSQSFTLASSYATEDDKNRAILWYKVQRGFLSEVRPMSLTTMIVYNRVTGEQLTVVGNQQPDKYSWAGGNTIYNSIPYPATSANEAPKQTTAVDPSNDPQQTMIAQARCKRADYLAQLSQTSALIEIPGNPNIRLGSMINITIPRKTGYQADGSEERFSANCMVTKIRHKIKPEGQVPRYTMILEITKGNSWND